MQHKSSGGHPVVTNVPLTERFKFDAATAASLDRARAATSQISRQGIRKGRSGKGVEFQFTVHRRVKRLIRSRLFNNTVYLAILAGCVLSGLETYASELGQVGRRAMHIGDIIVISIFCIEAFLKIYCKGRRYFKILTNCFDFSVTVMSLVLLLATSTAIVNPLVFSLFRLFRCLELVSHSKELRWICAGFMGGIQSLLYIITLMSVVLFVYAVTGVFYFGRNDPYNFGSLQEAAISLLKITTLDDWQRIFYANFFGCYWACGAAPMFAYSDTSRCVNSEAHPKVSLLYFGRYVLCLCICNLCVLGSYFRICYYIATSSSRRGSSSRYSLAVYCRVWKRC
jgi:voltage-gated sodium channel